MTDLVTIKHNSLGYARLTLTVPRREANELALRIEHLLADQPDVVEQRLTEKLDRLERLLNEKAISVANS